MFPTPPNKIEGKDYQVLGQGTGKATGIMLFQFIPINQNERFRTAYDRAVASKGGTRLLDPKIEESWFWAYLLNGYVTTVSGTVVKDITTGKMESATSESPKNAEGKIRELKKLYDDGLIKKEEFEAKKQKYIDEL